MLASRQQAGSVSEGRRGHGLAPSTSAVPVRPDGRAPHTSSWVAAGTPLDDVKCSRDVTRCGLDATGSLRPSHRELLVAPRNAHRLAAPASTVQASASTYVGAGKSNPTN